MRVAYGIEVDDSAEVGVGLSCVGDRACADGNGGFDACGATQACVGVLVTSGGLTVCHISFILFER